MSTIALHPKQRLISVEKTIFSIERIMTGAIFQFLGTVIALPWIVGMIALMTVGLFYTTIFYLPAWMICRQNRKLMQKLIQNMDKLEDRQLMVINADIEYLMRRLRGVIRKSRSFFVFKPLTDVFVSLLREYRHTNETLTKRLYPNIDQPLTGDETNELIEAFRQWEDPNDSAHANSL